MANGTGEPLTSAWDPTRYLVIVPAASFDRRTTEALGEALRRPGAIVRSVHVASDDAEAATLAMHWFEHDLPSLDFTDLEPPLASSRPSHTGWSAKPQVTSVPSP
jgi:hypothetical protein